jgi:hypothetical protein
MRRILRVLTLVLVALLASAKTYAQSDRVIVMACTFGNPVHQMTITLDLASKAATMEVLHPNPGGSPDPIRQTDPRGTVSQITDRQITFVTGQGTINQWVHTLDRYTGRDSVRASSWTADWTCQKQQKQF